MIKKNSFIFERKIMKPIQSAFNLAKAAACLANEWRDTILYTAFFMELSAREFVRNVAWTIYTPSRLVGDNSAPIDCNKNSSAAFIVFNGFGIAFALSLSAVFFDPISLVAAPFFLMCGSNALSRLSAHDATLRDIPHLYFNKENGMWDWPRKNGGGGTTQTQKMKDGFTSWGRKIVAAIPRPAWGATSGLVPIPAKSRQMPQPR